MGRIIGRLTARQVSNAAPKKERDALWLADGGNLYLQATRGEDGHIRRSWVFRCELNGRRRDAGLGPLHTRGLKEAREEARRLRLLLLDKVDPLEHRKKAAEARAVEAAKDKTFAEVAAAYIAAHRADWRNPKHAKQWEASLTKEAKVIANIPISAINTSHILSVLEPIWRTKPETASRTRGRIERVIAYAIAAEYRRREDGNPARWDGHLQELLGSKANAQKDKRARTGRSDNFAALPYADLPAFMTELRINDSLSARALEFTILTAARTGEVIGAPWQEFNIETATWCVPGERMKGGRQHRVPLCDRCITILRDLPRRGSRVFDLSNMAMLELLRGMRPGIVTHGFRATFKTWASECTRFEKDVVEAALAHRLGDNETEAAYQRGDLLAKRQRLMKAWAEFCWKPAAKAGANVTPIRAAADA
jgi:integrase